MNSRENFAKLQKQKKEDRANVVDPEQDVVADPLDGGKSVQKQRHRIDRDDREDRPVADDESDHHSPSSGA